MAFITDGAERTTILNTHRIGPNYSYPTLLAINYGLNINVNDQRTRDAITEYVALLRSQGWESSVIPADPRAVSTNDLDVMVKDGVFVGLISVQVMGNTVVSMDIGPYPFSRR
jgi:hypothetical protein